VFHKKNNLVWGVVLVLLGGLLLVQNLGFIPDFSQGVWAIILGAACIFFIAAYLFNGVENWGWIFPIFITGGLALTAVLSLTAINPIWLGAGFMASLSVPFWIVYLFNRKENWWALIPGWAMAVLTLIILLSETMSGEIIGTLVMWAIALPFIFIYAHNRDHWWALIPGFIMTGIGVVVLLSGQNADEVIGAFVLLMIAAPFLAVFFFTKGNWWAIIPAGILTTLGLMVPFAAGIEGDSFEARLVAVFMFLGFSIPFGWLWLRRNLYPTGWAKYPTFGLIAAAVVTLIAGTVIENSWAVLLIVIGAWLLYDNLHQPKLKS
jgi:hypothetical protein